MKELKPGDIVLYKTSTIDNLPVRIVSIDEKVIEFEREDRTPPGTIRVVRSAYSVIENNKGQTVLIYSKLLENGKA